LPLFLFGASVSEPTMRRTPLAARLRNANASYAEAAIEARAEVRKYLLYALPHTAPHTNLRINKSRGA
jgi:hypothetical protein